VKIMEVGYLIYMLMVISVATTGGIIYLTVNLLARLRDKLYHTSKMSRLPRSVYKPLRQARQYGQLITKTAQECPPGPIRSHLKNLTVKHVDESLESLGQLEESLITLYSHRNIKRELNKTYNEIEQISRELMAAENKQAKLLRRLLKSKREYLVTLEEMQEFQQHAELEIRKIASDLTRAHAEMLLVITKGDFSSSRLNRLDENIQEHLSSLRDIIHVMDELGYSRMAAS
ncbi:hypothetical protein QUF58_12920, partial [Anaerolineales bacterium HSG24]|nr:hypothetical protein [Anaerolineales bacterium HSG24]